MEFRLLGDLEVRAAGRSVDVGPPRQRAVLAVLAVEAGRPVAAATLIGRVWGGTPAATARDQVYAYVSDLRGRLAAAAAAAGEPAVLIERRPAGYLLAVDPGAVDLHRFRALVAQAREPGRAEAEQAAALGEALHLWQGRPLAGLAGPWATSFRNACCQERLDAAIGWARAELTLGHPDTLIAILPDLIAEYPLAEPLEALIIQALHAVGRDAEALDRYASVRSRLAEELGTEPGSTLRALHESILRGTPLTTAGAGRRLAPAQLPPDIPDFTGREPELAELTGLLSRAADQPAAVIVSAVAGTAGVGKTALAVHWAHRARAAFPDGQLYANLRGYDISQPVPAAAVLAGFLTALGVAGPDIPLDLDDRAAQYRTEISGRRMLVVLDNAASVEQVRALLPGTPSCVALVTSRDSLAGLVALHGAHRVDLDLLPADEAVTLLRTLIGERAEADPTAAATLAEQCARLPLALRVAAELATAQPGSPLASLVDELADEQQRLNLLDTGGDPHTAVRAVFSCSYQHLPPDAARVFRLLGLHPGADWDAHAAAALAGTTVRDARRLLDTLGRSHLIHAARAGRSGMHDLLRAYAAELARTVDSPTNQRAALTRLFDYYLDATATAVDWSHPTEGHRRPQLRKAAPSTPPLTGPATAKAWLDTERANLVAVCGYTAVHGWTSHTAWLAGMLFRYLDRGGHYPDALAIFTHAHTAARYAGDRAAEAHALISLGRIHFWQSRYVEASDHFERAVALFRQLGDLGGQARALSNHGGVQWRQGRYRQAADTLTEALTLFRETGDLGGEARALSNLGLVQWRQGRHQEAAETHLRALALFRETNHVLGVANAMGNLGAVYARQGRFAEAIGQLRQVLTFYRENGRHTGEAYALTNLGAVYGLQGRWDEAADHQRQALALFRATGDRGGEAEALNGLGQAVQAAGHPDEARAAHAEAREMAAKIGDRYQQARAYEGLGHSAHAVGDHGTARQQWHHALQLYTDLGAEDAAALRSHLERLA